MTFSANKLRNTELIVLGVGLLIALIAIGSKSGDAFRANMAWTKGDEKLAALLFTLASLLVVAAISIVPYALLAFLGKRIAGNGQASWRQIAGFIVSCGVTLASAFLYADALYTVSHDRSSTAGLVFVVVPVFLSVIGGAAYSLLIMLHTLAQKRKNGAIRGDESSTGQ